MSTGSCSSTSLFVPRGTDRTILDVPSHGVCDGPGYGGSGPLPNPGLWSGMGSQGPLHPSSP